MTVPLYVIPNQPAGIAMRSGPGAQFDTLATVYAAETLEVQDVPSAPAPAPSAPAPQGNLLQNPAFEGGTYMFNNDGDMKLTPVNWTPWWLTGDGKGCPPNVPSTDWKKPHIELETHPTHVKVGKSSARLYTGYSVHTGGLYQTVAATPGMKYLFSIYGFAWSTNNPQVDTPSSTNATLRVAIDPAGGGSPAATGVVWGAENSTMDKFVQLSIEATAKTNRLTVFTYAKSFWCVARNDSFWDAASLTAVGAVVAPDSPLSRVGVAGQWLKVKAPSGLIGWVDGGGVQQAFVQAVTIAPSVAQPTAPIRRLPWTEAHALAGLHGPVEQWSNKWNDTAFDILARSHMEAVKIIAGTENPREPGDPMARVLDRLRGMGIRFIMARLFAQFGQPTTPASFANDMLPVVRYFSERGIRYFEVHNEPNLHANHSPEGMYVAWQNGAEFGRFFMESVRQLKAQFPNAQFGFPGVSPGPQHDFSPAEPFRRAESEQFLREADEAIRSADFVCTHTYWGADGTTYQQALGRIRTFCNKYPDQPVMVTEFSNTAPISTNGKQVKGQEYARFYAEALALPANLAALFSFTMEAYSPDKRTDYFPNETWVDSPIPDLVGARPKR